MREPISIEDTMIYFLKKIKTVYIFFSNATKSPFSLHSKILPLHFWKGNIILYIKLLCQNGSPAWIRTMVKGFGDPYTNHCATGLE